MNEFDLLKYRVEDMNTSIDQIKNQLVVSKVLTSSGEGNELTILCDFSIRGSSINYEVILIDGENATLSLTLNDEVVSTASGKIMAGALIVKNNRRHNLKVVSNGIGCGNLRVRLEGAGLRII